MKKKLFLICVFVLFAGIAFLAVADWDPGDGHKMHFPQLPDPFGWDVAFYADFGMFPLELADDWECSETGPVSDVHFWISWYADDVFPLQSVRVRIYSNNPMGPNGWSEPNELRWEREFLAGQFTERQYGIGDQGWYDPWSGYFERPNHFMYFQVNIADINDPFIQREGEIYWLSLELTGEFGNMMGWKTSLDHWNDDAVWREPGGPWIELRDPLTQESLDFSFVITTEEEPKPLMPHTKWSQPPIEIDPTSEVPTYCGWDEQSHNKVDSGTPLRKIVADDFRCLGSMPVTSIHWWGSFFDWEWSWAHGTLPPVLPEKWSIGFWSNVPALAPPYYLDYSYPDILLHSIKVDANRVTFEEVGSDEYYGYYPYDICYQYNVDLRPDEVFWQDDFNNMTQDRIYWMSIVAEYNDTAVPYYPWGWKTRPWHWMDDAVTFNLDFEPAAGFVLDPFIVNPIKDPVWQESFDVAFELDTDPNYIKWEQLYTGIRHWPHYEDVKSVFNIEFPLEETLVADDWKCLRKTPVTAIVWWGSYIGYQYEACGDTFMPLPVSPNRFRLSIWTDVPLGDPGNPYPYSHPGEIIWTYETQKYDEVLVGYDKHPEYEPPYRTEPVFRYSARLPKDAWFQQPDVNGVFWLSVQAVYDNNMPNYDWGWTNHEHVFNDDAVQGTQVTSGEWTWTELYDQTGASEDMSFILFTEPDCMKVTNPDYADWVAFGKPDCWCYERQCRGDANGKKQLVFWVYSTDLSILKSSYAKAVLPPGGICADFDHKKQLVFRVYSNDLTILKSYYGKTEPSVPPCGSPPDSNYNFWIVP